MINKMIKSYNDARLSFIHKLSGLEEGILSETDFLDDATIECRISKAKKEFKNISEDISLILNYNDKDEYSTRKMGMFLERKNEVGFEIVFLASNSLSNLDACDGILNGLTTDFKICIDALKYYRDKDYQKSFELFYEYFRTKDSLIDHFLINKTYGTLLCRCRQYDIAIPFLRKAIEKRPDDIESHRAIKEAYFVNNMNFEANIHEDILSILEA